MGLTIQIDSLEDMCALMYDNRIQNSTERRKPKKFDLENYSCYGKIESKTRDDERLQKHRQDSRGERG